MSEETTTVQGQEAGGSDASVAEGGTDTNGGAGTAQAEGTASTTETLVEGLPEELKVKEKELLRAFHAKTQALAEKERTLLGEAEKYKADAGTLYELTKQEWFAKAIKDEKARRSGVRAEITDEEFEAAKSDKGAFQRLLAQRDQSLIEGIKTEFKGQFEKLGKSQQEILTGKEFDTTAGIYGDEFTQANEAGALDKYLDKNYDYETAFKLHMQDQGKVARKISSARTDKGVGAIEKGGMAQVRGGQVMKAKNLNEALEIAFDLARKGKTDYRLSKE